MKKSILLFCMFLNISIYAQEKSFAPNENAERSFVAFTVGGIFPMGNFASTADPGLGIIFGGDFPGFAKIGYHAEIEGTKFFTSNFGITGMAGFGFNAFDKNAYQNLANSSNVDPFPDPNVTTTENFSFSNYRHIFIMIGPSVGFRQGKISFEGRFLFGIMNTTFFNGVANQTTTTETTDSAGNPFTRIETMKSSLSASSSTSLALSIGATFRYSLNEHWGLLFKAETIWTTQKYTVKETDTYTSNDPSYNYYNYYNYQQPSNPVTNINMPITMFNIGVCLAYEF